MVQASLTRGCACNRSGSTIAPFLLIQALRPMPLDSPWACKAEQKTESLEDASCCTQGESSVLDLLVNLIRLSIHLTC